MLIFYLLGEPYDLLIPLLILIASYMKILSKMGKSPIAGVIPVIGEYVMSVELFRRRRVFWRPFIITTILIVTVFIIGDDSEYGYILLLVAFIVYGLFLVRLYWKLSRQFGKSAFFAIALILVPFIFLPILAFGKSVYLGRPEPKPERMQSKASKNVRRAWFVIISILEVTFLVLGCFVITTIVHPLRPVAEFMMNDTISKLSSVTATDEAVGRDKTLGANFKKIVDKQRSRDYFFPKHSANDKVVVMNYIIGSNLEDDRGSASINIAQMKDATAKGDGLDFVIEAGGSERWFTSGIEDATVGRYVISGGKLETAKMLDENTCMSEPEELTDFIQWTKKNYPADRYMLILWDHGGGFASGYGSDDLNYREDDEQTMSASEVIGAIEDADTKFDLIGFDACLMQNIEYANALEPYADYYLASEETEPGTGWFYTAGFGAIAEDPSISTEDFGKMMVSSYDQCNRAVNSGEVDHESTLSLVDLTLVKPVYKKLTGFYKRTTPEIVEKPAVYANLSAARSRAYQFYDEEQVDMVSFLDNLKKADYKQLVMKDEEIDKMSKAAKACVVWRNNDSADGINGIAIDFPYSDLEMYSYEHDQLKAVNYKKERKFFDNFCSIMASQRMADNDDESFWGILTAEDYTDEPWFIKGFEDYDTTGAFVDIPVKKTKDGYLPDLPEKTWDTIVNCKLAAYVVTDDGLMYIGQEHNSDEDANGHPLFSMDGYWVHINGHVVCYETEEPLVTDDGTIYRGTVKARLNGIEDITIHIEWDPVKEATEEGITGHVTGYSRDNEKVFFFMKKGLEQFETGDSIEFMFDFYDREGNLKRSKPYGDKLTVISDESLTSLTAKDEAFESGTEFSYFGVLTDVYQRDLMTEEIREQVN